MEMTDWLLAGEDEAEAIASIVTTEEHDFEDWTHLSFPLIQMELMALRAVLEEDDALATDAVVDEPLVLDEEAGHGVARVRDSFIQALARVKPGSVRGLVGRWTGRIDLEHHEVEVLQKLLGALADFARTAVARESPVLELMTF